MAALGVPLALLLGVLADLVGSLVRRSPRFRPLVDLRKETQRALAKDEPIALLELAGGGAALLGAGLIAAAAIGAAPGDPALLVLALVLAVAGGHLAASDPPTRPAAARARARALESGLALAGAAAGLVAVFVRWRADDLGVVWGAGEVLGFPLSVGPPAGAVGQGLALLTVAVAAGLLVPLETERPRGRHRRPAPAALLLRLIRWAVAGSLVAILAAMTVGFDLTEGAPVGPWAMWAGGALVAAVVAGAAWGFADRIGPGIRLRGAVPVVTILGVAAAALASVSA